MLAETFFKVMRILLAKVLFKISNHALQNQASVYVMKAKKLAEMSLETSNKYTIIIVMGKH